MKLRVLLSSSVVIIGLGLLLFPVEQYITAQMYPSSKEGTLICLEGVDVVRSIHTKEITYLGNGEWKLLHSATGQYGIYSKSIIESCAVVPGEYNPPAPKVSTYKEEPSRLYL